MKSGLRWPRLRGIAWRTTVCMLVLGVLAPTVSAERGGLLPEPRTPILAPEAYAPLRSAWREVHADLERKAWAEAAGQVERLVSIRTELGLPNLYELSSALLYGARDATASGASDAADHLVAAAAALSPGLAGPKFESAAVAFDVSPVDFAGQVKGVRGGVESLSEDLPARFAVIANTLAGATFVLVALLLLLALSIIIRYRAVLVNDLRRLLPRGVDTLQAHLLLLALMLAPFFAGLGLLATAAIWLVIASFHMRLSERIAAIIMTSLLALLPLATTNVVRGLEYPNSKEAVIHRCNQSLCSDQDRERLNRWTAQDELAYEAAFTLGLVLKREEAARRGVYEGASLKLHTANRLKATAEGLTELSTLEFLAAQRECDGVRAGTISSVAVYQNQLKQAAERLEAALVKKPDLVAALYNLAILRYHLDQHEEGAKLMNKASRLDSEGVQAFNTDVARDSNTVPCRLVGQGNRPLMGTTLPPEALKASFLGRAMPNDALIMPFGGLFGGRLGTAGLALLGPGAAGLVLLSFFLAMLLRPSELCVECGSVADPRTRLQVGRGSVCENCVMADIRRGVGDAKEQWIRDQRIQATERRRHTTARIATWVLPGLGHMLRGKPLRGLIFLGIVVGGVLVALGFNQVVIDPRQPIGVGAGRVLLFCGVAGVAWLIALIDAHTGGSRR